jgi:Protein of unknown function (DUF2630)
VDDKTILDHIDELVAEEKRLRAAHAGRGLTGDDHLRLQTLERQLDQAWDLLRQRRAREEFGDDPDAAQERSAGDVEGYLQ